jgi:tetratricopeptide (TPR) repeat protein
MDRYFQIHASNIHAVLKWAIHEGRADLSFQLMARLEAAWSSVGYFKEGLDITQQALEAFPTLDPSLRAKWLQSASDLAWQQHDFDSALRYSQEAVDLGRTHGLTHAYPWCLNRLGRIYIEQGRLEEARQSLTQVLNQARADPSTINPGIPLAQLGEIALFESRLEEAESLFEQALPLLDNRDGIFLALTTTDLAEIALTRQDAIQARAWLRKAYEPASQHVRRWMVWLSALAGWLALAEDGDKRLAAGFYGAIETLTERTGVVLAAFHREMNRQRMERLQRDLSPADWQAVFEVGRQWNRDETFRLAKEVLGRA